MVKRIILSPAFWTFAGSEEDVLSAIGRRAYVHSLRNGFVIGTKLVPVSFFMCEIMLIYILVDLLKESFILKLNLVEITECQAAHSASHFDQVFLHMAFWSRVAC